MRGEQPAAPQAELMGFGPVEGEEWRSFVGTIASGWLTDRYHSRKLLAVYYSMRGLALLLLPFVTYFAGLSVFAFFFGLDYIATVPRRSPSPPISSVGCTSARSSLLLLLAPGRRGSMAAYLGGIADGALELHGGVPGDGYPGDPGLPHKPRAAAAGSGWASGWAASAPRVRSSSPEEEPL